jgi:hypothetical protein
MRIKGSNGQAGADIQIPKMFYKVIAYLGKSRNDPARLELRAKAFVVTQETADQYGLVKLSDLAGGRIVDVPLRDPLTMKPLSRESPESTLNR